jgi:hypothetical protein
MALNEVEVAAGKTVLTNGVVTTYTYGDPGRGGASGWMFHIVSNGATGSITVSGRARGAQAETDQVAMSPIPYRSAFLNNAVGTNAFVNTAITNTSIIWVPATGLSIGLAVTALTVGTFTVYATPIDDFVG